MTKFLLTGGAGFIGGFIAKSLAEDGYDVHIVDNFSRGKDDEFLHDLCSRENVKFSEVDLMQSSCVDKLDDDYDVIIHLAAILGVQNVLDRPYDTLVNNVILLQNTLEVAKKQKNLSRFVFNSTSEIYAGTLKYWEMEVPTPETTPLTVTDTAMPRTSYMLSKIYGEAMVQHAGIPYTILRPHNVYGPRMGFDHVVPQLLEKAVKAEKSLEVYSPDHTRTFCYIDDAVEIVRKVVETPECEGQEFNLGSQSPEISIRELAKIVIKTVDKELEIKDMETTQGSVARRCPKMEKIADFTGFRAKVTPEEGVAKTFEWYRKYF